MKLLILLVVSACIAGTASAANTPGLNYSYYEGDWSALPNFFNLTPVKKGLTPNIDLSVRNKDIAYAFLWQGIITIKVAGDYTFDTNSDDGSKLFIGAYGNSITPLVNNDGLHPDNTVAGTITLKAGDYPITIAFFQNGGGQTMEVYWSSNKGLARQKIPNNVLSHATSGLTYNYYEGNWNSIPDFSKLKPVKTGITDNFDLGVRAKDSSYGVIWRGNITIPETGKYTFETSSDDGSLLYLYSSQTIVVNNNGVHTSKTASGSITLNAGTFPIIVSYFQKSGGNDLKVYWSSNKGLSRQLIPDIAFVNLPTVVDYKYYEGNWSALPDFSKLTPVKTGMGVNIDLGVRNRNDSYAILWKSSINIPTDGDYTFETSSDDGSKVFINNNTTPLVNNDGLHPVQSAKGTIHLSKGAYPITVSFLQGSGDNIMQLYWSSNMGIARQIIPDKAFVAAILPIDTIAIPNVNGDTLVQEGMRGIHNYYFSSSTGDDMRTSTEAQNPATPWKTLNQLNSFFPNLQPGDAVLFKRGENFSGSINISRSGTKGSSIILSNYGSGAKPTINGFATLTGWTSLGGNIYEAPLATGVYLNLVTVNNVVKAKGRYPNTEYLTIDSRTEVDGPSPVFTGPGTFTDAELPASVNNWTGAEAVIRKNDWCLDKCPITGHAGTTISYYSPSPHTPVVGYGYFIQNDVRTLDVDGEWFYDRVAHTLKLYSTVDPASLVVKGGIVSSLVVVNNQSNILIDNLQFQGADTSVINITNGSDIVMQNCDINYSGIDVVHANNSSYIKFLNNSVYNSNSPTIYMNDCSNSVVKGDTLSHMGLLAGMGTSNFAGYGAIYVKGADNLIENNIVDSVGYNGIVITGGSNVLVKNNYVSNFCMVLGDGGGIYTNGDNDYQGRQIIGNIVVNGAGSFKGTTATKPRAASGIYLDELASHVYVADNTVKNCISTGIYLHQAYDNVLLRNTLVNNGISAISIVDDLPATARIRNNTVMNNILYARFNTQLLLNHGSTTNDLTLFGRYDSNFYCRPFDIGGYIKTQYIKDGTDVYSSYDIASWNKIYPDNGVAGIEAPAIKQFKVTSEGANLLGNGTFNQSVDGVVADANSTVTLDAKLDGNAAKFSRINASSSADQYQVMHMPNLVTGQTYRIRFSLLGSSNTQNLLSYIRSYDGPNYPIVSELRYFPLKPSRTECEYFYTVTDNEPSLKLVFVVSGALLPFWIDNVEVTPVNATVTNIDDFIRLEYNTSNMDKTIALDDKYTDPTGKVYNNQVTIKPYTSILLTKVPNQSSALASQRNTGKLAETDALLMESINANQHSSIYPNPATDVLATRLTTPKKGNISLVIYDGSGRIIQTSDYFKKELVFEKTVNVSGLRTGLYYLKIKFSDGTSMIKPFVKK